VRTENKRKCEKETDETKKKEKLYCRLDEQTRASLPVILYRLPSILLRRLQERKKFLLSLHFHESSLQRKEEKKGRRVSFFFSRRERESNEVVQKLTIDLNCFNSSFDNGSSSPDVAPAPAPLATVVIEPLD